jgi:hypothetical protein
MMLQIDFFSLDFKLITGLLTGSIATLVIKEVINQFNNYKAHERELSKATYLRKLEKAENAIAYYWTFYNNIITMKISMEVLIKTLLENKDLAKDTEIIRGVMDKSAAFFNDIGEAGQLAINSVHLYFDLDLKDNWDEKDNSDFLSALTDCKTIDSEVETYLTMSNEHDSKGNDEAADYFWEKAEALLPAYLERLKEVVNLLEKNKLSLQEVIKRIKTQLKQY